METVFVGTKIALKKVASIILSGMFESLLIGTGQCLSGGQANPA